MTNNKYVVIIDGNYYAGPNKKYSDMYDISGLGPLGASIMNEQEANNIRAHFEANGHTASIEIYDPRKYLKDALQRIIECDEKQRNDESIGYTIRNLAQKCIDYLEQIK